MPHNEPDTTTLRVEFSPAEVAVMSRGLVQRAHLTTQVLADLSGPQHLVEHGLIPPEVLAVTHGCPLPFELPAAVPTMVSADIVRNADGQWTTVADRTELPAGLGVLAELGGTPESLETLRHSTTEARAVVLTDPDYTPPHESLTPQLIQRDARALADALELPLLTPDQLRIDDWRLKGPDDDDVDLLISYVPVTRLDPLEPTASVETGIPGLVAVLQQGHARLHAHPAAALFASPALGTFLPRLCREVLGEDLLLHPVTSFWCGDRLQCSHVISRIGRLQVRSLATADAFDGRSLTIAQQADLCARIADEPWNWIAHESVEPAMLPLDTGGLSPFVVRAWASLRDDTWSADSTALGIVQSPGDDVRLAHFVRGGSA